MSLFFSLFFVAPGAVENVSPGVVTTVFDECNTPDVLCWYISTIFRFFRKIVQHERRRRLNDRQFTAAVDEKQGT